MAELVLRGVVTHDIGERRVVRAARMAAAAIEHAVRAVLCVAHWLVRAASPSMQTWVSGRGWTGLPGNPSPGAWLRTGVSSTRSISAR